MSADARNMLELLRSGLKGLRAFRRDKHRGWRNKKAGFPGWEISFSDKRRAIAKHDTIEEPRRNRWSGEEEQIR
jgi:hypothetical protein